MNWVVDILAVAEIQNAKSDDSQKKDKEKKSVGGEGRMLHI